MKKYKLGILGGRRGAFILYYIHMFKDELEVAAICESDPKVIEEVKANADMDSENVAFCSTFDELLRYDIDAVFLANSFNEHTEYAIKAMEKGIVVFSETTAAASLGECIDLVEAYERTGTTYMLSAECIYFRAVLAMKERIRRGEIGQVVYADAEYVHPRTPGNVEEVDKTNLHWRNTLPGCYYNMHDLGPLLYMTDSFPKRVVAKAAVVEGVSAKPLVNTTRCDALVETESGSVLHYSGFTGVGTLGKWYRIAGTGGTLESVRFDEVEKNIVVGGLHNAPDIVEIDWDDVDILTPEEQEKYFPKGRELNSHGGADILIILEFIKVLKGEKEPYFDVYRAVALSATAIMSWYSILSGSRQLDIPDFRIAEDREKHRGDYRQPFAKRYDDLTLPCSVKPSENFKVILEKEKKEMKKFRIGVFGGIRGTSFTACERVLGDQMEIVALCEKNPEVVRYDKEKNCISENVKIYTDFDEFIHSGLDAVVLCNYFYEHTKYAIKAMEAGVPVLSETTAGVSLGDCIDLVEAYERTGTKYMLGANCIFFKCVQAMKKAIKEGKIGDIVYGDAEYVCPPDEVANARVGGSDPNVDIHNLHWRNTLPRAYYNMHDMGPLMYISEIRPKRVIGKPAVTGHRAKPLINYDKFYSLVEMENGVVFNYAGGTSAGSESKWYRVAGTDGTVESVRYDKPQAQHIEANKFDPPVTFNLPWGETGAVTPEEEEKYFSKGADGMSHGGVDLILFIHFLRYLRDEEEPFFNVYRAVDLSATGIMAWYSALSGSRQLDVPDFRTKEARDKFRGDYRHPFAKDLKDITLPCEYSEDSDFQIYLK